MFGYPDEMKKELEDLGANVLWVPERPYNLLARIARNIWPRLYKIIADRYLSQILEKVSDQQLDYILIIGSAIINASFLEKLRADHTDAKLITYQWDSNKLHPYSHLLKYFDKCYSFDFNDCNQFPNLNYHPLFYLEKYKKLRNDGEGAKKYDLLHVGSLHPARYEIIEKIDAFCNENGIAFYYYLYTPFSSYLKFRIRGRRFTNAKFKKLDPEQILDLYKRSNVILDLPQVNQTGLTMRTFEVLGAGKKLLTTNKKLAEIDIYNEHLAGFCDLYEPVLFDKQFVKRSYKPDIEWLNKIEKYSLKNWLIYILKLN